MIERESDNSETMIKEIKENLSQMSLILAEIKKTYALKGIDNREIVFTRIRDLEISFKKLNERAHYLLREVFPKKTFFQNVFTLNNSFNVFKNEKLKLDDLEKDNLKKLKSETRARNTENEKKKIIEEDTYAKISNMIFSAYSRKLIKKDYFKSMEKDLERANLMHTFPGYVSIILFTTFLSLIFGLLVFLFFIFFKIEAVWPIVTFAEYSGLRILKLIWIPILFPVVGFLFSYSYPSMDRRSSEVQIDFELPFATINMAAISGSMINPVKIFEIIISSDEFPNIKKEFTKLVNEINIYGYDIVNALRNTSRNNPSYKLAELLNGLATTINSGGDLTKFLNKRAETLLFDHRIMKEKETKMAETFMDLYISIVIAAPMIFLLLLMVMKISGMGVSLPFSTINIIMVSAITLINIFFLVFLNLKKTD